MLEIIGGIVVLLIMILLSGIKVVKENSRLVVYHCGRLANSRGPGVHLILPVLESTELVDMRARALTTHHIECATRDGFDVRLTAVVMFQVGDPLKVVGRVADLDENVMALLLKVMREQTANFELETLRSDSRQVNRKLKSELEKQSRAWGLKINSVDLADVQAYSAVKPGNWKGPQDVLELEQVEI